MSTDRFNNLSIFSTFECNPEKCSLWAVAYHDVFINGKPVDILSHLFDQWLSTDYLLKFFKANEDDLKSPFWNGISIEDAVLCVQKEAIDFQKELKSFVLQKPDNRIKSLSEIFEKLDKHEFALKRSSQSFRKGKPNFKNPMLRLYAIELEEGDHIVTGGAIKLIGKMESEYLREEISKLIRVQDFLKSNGFYKGEEFP